MALNSFDAPPSAGGTHIRHPLGDRFIVLKELGRGASGVVTLCRRKADWQLFAIKEIYIGQDVEERRRIYAEAKLMMNIPSHPSIVRLEEVAESRDSVFLVLEYVPEGSIYNVVYPVSLQKEREERKEKKIAEREARRREKRKLAHPHRKRKANNTDLHYNDGGEVMSQPGSAGMNGTFSLAQVYRHQNYSVSSEQVGQLLVVHQPPGAVSSGAISSNTGARDVLTPSTSAFTGPSLDINCFSPSTPGDYVYARRFQKDRIAMSAGNTESGVVDVVNTTSATDFFYGEEGVQRFDGGDFGDAESEGYDATEDDESGNEHSSENSDNNCSEETYLDEDQVVKWFSQLANAVEFLHSQGVAHRDIKLDNILVCSGQTVVKICDFGVATSVGRAMTAGNVSRLFTSMTGSLAAVSNANVTSQAMLEHTTVGTPQYMAPEICDGRPHSLQCDVWSLGVSFYEICARRLPFDATNMLALMHKVIENPAKPLPSVYSPRLSAIILSMLAKDPRQRPTMKQVVQMLYYYQKLKKALDKSEQRAKEDPTNTIFKEENEFATSAFLDCTQMGVKDFVLPQQPTNPRTLAQMLSDHSSISTFTKSPTETLGP